MQSNSRAVSTEKKIRTSVELWVLGFEFFLSKMLKQVQHDRSIGHVSH